MFRGHRRHDKWGFDEVERMIEELNHAINQMMRSLSNEPLVYGFSVQVGPDGIPHVEHFGNVRAGEKENVREPFTSSIVDEKSNELKITAEMPGVEKKDIEVNATENEVIISAESYDRKYYKKIKTPCSVDPDSATGKYNNGVLEVTLKLKEPIKPKGKTIKIE